MSIGLFAPVAFRFRWFGYKMGVQCPPYPPPEMRRYGTAGPHGNPTGTPNPRPNSKPPCNNLWMTTNPSATVAAWLCIAIIATPAPLLQLQRSSPPDIRVPLRPVSPYGWQHDAAGRGNALPAVFQKNRDIAISLAARLIELRSRRKPGGLSQEYRRPVAAEGAFGRAGAAAGRNAGTGRAVDANRPGAY